LPGEGIVLFSFSSIPALSPGRGRRTGIASPGDENLDIITRD
jgi:hypothetical protein